MCFGLVCWLCVSVVGLSRKRLFVFVWDDFCVCVGGCCVVYDLFIWYLWSLLCFIFVCNVWCLLCVCCLLFVFYLVLMFVIYVLLLLCGVCVWLVGIGLNGCLYWFLIVMMILGLFDCWLCLFVLLFVWCYCCVVDYWCILFD